MHKLLLILLTLLLAGCSARLPLNPSVPTEEHEEDCPDGSCKLPGHR